MQQTREPQAIQFAEMRRPVLLAAILAVPQDSVDRDVFLAVLTGH
jgi:hypothetical protein